MYVIVRKNRRIEKLKLAKYSASDAGSSRHKESARATMKFSDRHAGPPSRE